MKEWDILVIDVIIMENKNDIFSNIFRLHMKVSDILVVSVIIKLQEREIWRGTLEKSILVEHEINYNKKYLNIK